MLHLDADRWAEVSLLLDRLLDLPAEERQPYLDRSCTDPDVRADVERLWSGIERAASAEGAFSGGALGGALGEQLVQEDGPGLAPGTAVGAYRIAEEVGRGGMGMVYLAERADGAYEQRVALKRVRRGFATASNVRRFLRERQVLARLEHPHIARLLDAGVAGGLPYLVMEYVEGEPITDYAARKRLGLEARLDLFAAVCAAVRYAHQHLVVHRDLKPSNVLVAEDDEGRPVPKLLDFGIAKLLDAGDETALTEAGLRPMTRAYAAPEQLRGEAVTTATDVYALGVLLFELLTGRRPFDASTPAQLEAAVLGDDPPRPSAALRRANGSAEIAPRQLHGDLDTIALYALQKDPAARYESAAAFAEDVRRHRARLPIAARAPSVRYRAGRFVARHRAGVAAAALVVLSLVGGLGAALWQAEVAEAAAKRAEAEAATAEQVSAFLTSMFESARPEIALGDTLTVYDLLSQGVTNLDTLSGRPEVHAEMLSTLGMVYLVLGDYDEARPLLERALTVRREVHGGDHPDLAQSMNDLAVLRVRSGTPLEAESLFRETLAMRRRLFSGDHQRVAQTLTDLAQVLTYKGEHEEVLALYEEIAGILRRLLGDREPIAGAGFDDVEASDFAAALNNLGAGYSNVGRFKEAEVQFQKMLAIRRVLHGDSSTTPGISLGRSNLSNVLRAQGEYEEAEALAREALEGWARVHSERHFGTAIMQGRLGEILVETDRFDEAEPLLRRAYTTLRDLFGDAHRRTAAVRRDLGRALAGLGRYPEAEQHLKGALAFYESEVGGAFPEYRTVAREAMVELYEAWGRVEAAEPYRAEG